MDQVAARLTEHALGLEYEAVPDAARDKAKQLILDLLGIALCASATADSSPALRETMLAVGRPGSATLIGEEPRLHPIHAAYLNGAYAHSLDADDTHRAGSIHPGAPIIPALLALAEENQLGGRRLIAAMVAGYDVTCKLAMAIDPRSHYARGFHPTATCGVFGATAAGANLLGLDQEVLRNGFGINLSQSAGSQQFLVDGAWTKRIHPAQAASNAILALELAQRGFKGPADCFEGQWAFFHGYSDNAHPELAVDGLGTRFEILETAVKPYPCCRYAHGALDLILKLQRDHGFRAGEVEAVRIGVSEVAAGIIGRPVEHKRDPQSIVDGQFSMHFLAAAALTRGQMAWADYDLLGDPGLPSLMAKVDVVSSADADRVFPAQWLTEVQVKAGGRTFAESTAAVRGEPESPLSWDELTDKFNSLAASAIPDEGRRRRLAEMVRNLEEVQNLRELGDLLQGTRRR